MNKILLALTSLIVMASFSAQATSLESCRIEVRTDSLAVGLLGEYGKGKGVAVCKDSWGNDYKARFQLGLLGTGLKAGFCHSRTVFTAVGAGFALDQLFAEIGRAEIGSMLLFRKSVGAAYRVNPAGISVDIGVTESDYSGLCGGIASISKMWILDDGFFDWN